MGQRSRAGAAARSGPLPRSRQRKSTPRNTVNERARLPEKHQRDQEPDDGRCYDDRIQRCPSRELFIGSSLFPRGDTGSVAGFS